MNLAITVSANEIGGKVEWLGLTGEISAVFGRTDDVHMKPHSGGDCFFPVGSTIKSPVAGRIVKVSRADDGSVWASIFGNSVVIACADGTLFLFAHFRDTLSLNVGDYVVVGGIIGVQGSTGQSQGDHVHVGMSTTDNPDFRKDDDGGVSRLLDPFAHVGEPHGAAGTPIAMVPVTETTASVSALVAGTLDESAARLRYFATQSVPEIAVRSELQRAASIINAAVARTGG